MSHQVRLSSKLPGNEEINGLDAHAKALADKPGHVVVAIVWIDAQKVTETQDSENRVVRVPTAQIRKIEPIGDSPQARAKVAELYTELNEARLGMSPLPFDQLQGRTELVEVRSADDDQDDE